MGVCRMCAGLKTCATFLAKLFPTKRQQMPSESAHHRARQGVEGADKDAVVERPLPSSVQSRFHRETFGHNSYLTKSRQERAKLADAELEDCRRVLVFEADLHQLRERVQPRNPVVDLEHRLAARFQHAAAFVDQLRRG